MTVALFKHTIINNIIVVILKKFKYGFCKISLHVPLNPCLFDNYKMNRLVVIKTTKKKFFSYTPFINYTNINTKRSECVKEKLAKYQFTFRVYS